MAEQVAEVPSKVTMVTLHPINGFNNLRERYTEDTADVFFVDKETKERLPAHKQVLSVASAVFFKMFDGDWKEKGEKEIPAPEEYNWESFKAALALLYSEEVEIKESSIVDIYRVAHCYDLKDVVYALVQDIRQWDSSMVAAMMKLFTLTVRLETDEDQMQKEVLQAVMQYLARNVGDITREALAGLTYQEMLMLVQLEHIQISEVDLLSKLNQWIKDHPDLTVVQAEKLFSHIRFGTIPYEALVACEVGHKNLSLALQNYHKPFERVGENMVQVTPRLCQKDVSPVFPVISGPPVLTQGDKCECSTFLSPAVGMMYFGRQEVSFKGSIRMAAVEPCTLVCELSTISGIRHYWGGIVQRNNKRVTENLQDRFNFNGAPVDFCYQNFNVILNATGAHIVLQCTDSPLSSSYDTRTRSISKPLELPFGGPFPWLLTFGLTHERMPPVHSFTFTYPTPHT